MALSNLDSSLLLVLSIQYNNSITYEIIAHPACNQGPGLSRYGDFYNKDKTVVGPSYLHNGNSCTGKTMMSLYWDSPQMGLLL